MSVKDDNVQKGKERQVPQNNGGSGGLHGDTGPGTAGPRSKVVLHSYLPGKGTHESGEEAARQRSILDGAWTALDGWLGSQGHCAQQ